MKKDPEKKNPSDPSATPAESKKKKKAESEGSRFAALFILILTVLLSLIFYWQSGAANKPAANKDPAAPSFVITK